MDPDVVESLGLKEGDEIAIRIEDACEVEVAHARSRQKALERLRKLRRPLPPGFAFDRQTARER